MRLFLAVAAASSALLLAAPAAAAAQGEDRQPRFSFSVADKPPGHQVDGPLSRKAIAALQAVRKSNPATIGTAFANDARLRLMVRGTTGPAPQMTALSAEAIRAAFESCHGPYSYDEGAAWAQLSWICRVDADAPITRFLTFRDSPELTLTVWFAGDRIKEIMAMEPLPLPGQRFVRMDAYQAIKPKP